MTSDTQSKRTEYQQLTSQLEKQAAKCERIANDVADMGSKLKSAQSKTMTSEERTQQLENMLREEDLDLEAAKKEVSFAHEQEFKANQRVQSLLQEEAARKQDVNALKMACKNTASRLGTVEKEVAQQDKLLYQQDFQLATLKRDLANMEGKRNKEEEELFQKQKLGLKEQLNEEEGTKVLLQTQIGAAEV